MMGPREVVQSAFTALKARDYNTLALLCDPLSLEAFKQDMLDEYCPPDEPDMDGSNPVIELTEQQYVEMIEFLDPVRRMQQELPTLTTLDQLQSMSPADLFATWMYAHSAERFSDEQLRRPWKDESDWRDDRRDDEPRYVVIGCVFDTPHIAHVLYRNQLSALEASPDGYGTWLRNAAPPLRDFMTAMNHRGDPILITCRRQSDGSWKLIAQKHFMLFGTLSVSLVSDEDES